MNDKKQRGRPRKPAPSEILAAAQAIEPDSQIVTTECGEVVPCVIDGGIATPVSIHQVLGEMSDILTAPQEVKRSGYKW